MPTSPAATCSRSPSASWPNAAVLDAVRAHLADREVVELVATIAACNIVSRFLEALHIHSDDARSAAASA